MQCPNCKAEIENARVLCPQCGVELSAAPTVKPAHPRQRWIQRLLIALLAVSIFVGSVAGATYAGLYYGEKDQDSRRAATIETHYQNGLKALNEGQFQRSISEFQYVLQLDPQHVGARQGLATANDRLSVKPTPTSEVAQSIAGQLLTQAQTAYQNKNWTEAANTLTQLRALDSSYNQTAVEEMLFNSLYNAGKEFMDKDELESGIFYLDQAVALRPLDSNIVNERNLAAHYLSALGYWGVDWAQCISELEELEAIAPGYKDVSQRIYEAYMTEGDYWSGIGEMCPAQQSYTLASQRYANDTVNNKLNTAAQTCLLATPTPISGTTQILTPQPIAGFNNGRLAYPVYNTGSGQYDLYALYADGRILLAAAGADQPVWEWGSGRLAYRNKIAGGIGIVHPEVGGAGQLLAAAGQAWPSLSPDGQRIAYAAAESDGSWSIYLAPVNGSAPRKVTAGWAPVWSRTGALAYTSCEADKITCGIFIDSNPDDDQPGKRLTGSENDIATSWAPGGNLLAYMSNISGDWDVFLLDTSGGVAQLTSDPANDGLPVWAPDGSQLAFVSNRDGAWAIYLVAPDGQNVRRVITLSGDFPGWTNQRMSWSP